MRQSTPSTIEFGSLWSQPGFVMRRAQALLQRELTAMLAPIDLNAGQYMLLTVIGRNPGVSQSALGRALWIKRSNIVVQLRELERRKLIKRRRSESDRRVWALHLTSAGADLLTQATAVSAAHNRKITAVLGATDAGRLTRRLLRIVKAFRRV